MRILVISHSAAQPTYHRKFEEVCTHPDIELRVLVPENWIENEQRLCFSTKQPRKNLTYLSAPVVFPGYGSRFVFTRDILRHFKDFEPHLIHLEEEPWSLSALQTLLLRRAFCPSSKLIFRTSLSIPIQLRFSILARAIERLTFRESDLAFSLSQKAADLLRQKGFKGEIKIGPNGVDTELFFPRDQGQVRRELGLDMSGSVVGYVGRLLRMKGLNTLLESFADLGQGRLLLVGGGEHRDQLVKKANELGIEDRVVWTGPVPAKMVPKYMNCMDVLVLPSRTTPGWVEFFGRVLVEAMACGVPVIGSDSGEIPRVIDQAGLVFPEGNNNRLTGLLSTVLADSTLRASLREKGLARAQQYSWQAIGRDTYDTYRTLIPRS